MPRAEESGVRATRHAATRERAGVARGRRRCATSRGACRRVANLVCTSRHLCRGRQGRALPGAVPRLAGRTGGGGVACRVCARTPYPGSPSRRRLDSIGTWWSPGRDLDSGRTAIASCRTTASTSANGACTAGTAVYRSRSGSHDRDARCSPRCDSSRRVGAGLTFADHPAGQLSAASPTASGWPAER